MTTLLKVSFHFLPFLSLLINVVIPYSLSDGYTESVVLIHVMKVLYRYLREEFDGLHSHVHRGNIFAAVSCMWLFAVGEEISSAGLLGTAGESLWSLESALSDGTHITVLVVARLELCCAFWLSCSILPLHVMSIPTPLTPSLGPVKGSSGVSQEAPKSSSPLAHHCQLCCCHLPE